MITICLKQDILLLFN